MTTQISVESISLTTHQNIPVITTELLAQLYGTEVIRIQQNQREMRNVLLRENIFSNWSVRS